MSLVQRLNENMKQAMREKDKERLNVIRMVKASLQNEAINLGVSELSAEDELTILSRELKQRNESLKEFSEAGREDLVQKVEAEIVVLEEYMPAQLTGEELEDIVKQTIAELNATSKSEFGKVMGKVMPKIKGKADGSSVRDIVQQLLNE